MSYSWTRESNVLQQAGTGVWLRHKLRFVGLSLFAGFLWAVGPPLHAQTRSLEDWIIDPDVIGPTRRPRPLSTAPSTTTIITAEEIRRSTAMTLPDLLRIVPGLDVFRISAADANVTARGLNTRIAHRMQVFIDGRSVYEDFLNLVSWHQLPISLQEIERIEIVKSPASALFGSNAFSGVIHIITKSPKELEGTQISETAGNAGTHITTVLHAGVWDKIHYKLMFEHDRTNHYPNRQISPARKDDKGREDFRGNFFTEYHFNKNSRASLAAGIDYFDRDIDPGLVPTPNPSRVFGRGGLGFVKLNYALDDFKAQFVWDRIDMDLHAPFLPQRVPFLGNTSKLDLQHSVNLGSQNILTAGFSYRYTTFESRFLVGHGRRQNAFGVFLQDEYSPLNNLTVTVGASVDTHPQAGVHFAPRGSIVYSPWDGHILRASISRAFRNPSVLENFINFGILTGLPAPANVITIRGDRNARAEEITSYEIGYQARFFQRLKARVDLFYNRLDNMSTGPVPTGAQQVSILNGGGGSMYGGEVGLEFLLWDWLLGYMNYSYQDRDVSDSRVLGMAPRHKGNLGLNFILPKGFEADFGVTSVGESSGFPGQVGPHTTVNLRLGYQFKLWGSDGRITFGAANLLNDRHREIPGGDTLNRRITGGIQFKF